ncbi:sulfatase [Parazoarcus communis]|uniref:Sulfatase n=1 Tax=Parazoarcus communis TaxID=41977 RepID=A0A2U8GT55_9RHOO|nr:LTA synthase family protein [Parazoarcus communis]AWI76852.1 sulfatase [Parazoarcus communis]
MSWLHSRRIRFLCAGVTLFFILFAALRLGFLIASADHAALAGESTGVILQTISIGLRFDLRLALLIMLPVAFAASLPRVNLVRSRFTRALTGLYLALATLLVLLVYVLDFGHYSYLGQRLSATVFRFAGNADISTRMLWESYPVVWISLGWLALTAAFVSLLFRAARVTLDRPRRQPIRPLPAIAGIVLVSALGLLGMLGRVDNINPENPVPLRWSDAFFSGNAAVGALGLNPVTFIYDTHRIPPEKYDLAELRRHYDTVAHYLSVDSPDPATLSMQRTVKPHVHRLPVAQAPNVVFIMLESLGASRSGLFGNPLDPTPELDALAREGWLFRNLHVPVTGTAKTVWASITGIPDAARSESATRNPFISSQHSVINALRGYEKIYAVGGSAGWANMNALVLGSIDKVRLYEEGHWRAPNDDVWGISDLNLFREIDAILREQARKGPFFAYIQTAGNHRPFTIPEDNDGFIASSIPDAEAQQAGFQNTAQFNAVRLLDHNVGRFIEMARASGYYDNTIFVLFGDHNGRISTLPFMPPAFELLGLESTHVHAMIHAPKLIQPRLVDEAASLVDLMPTVAGMLGLEFGTATMGRDLQYPAPEGERAVPVILREGAFPVIGAVTRKHLVRMNADGSKASMHDLAAEAPLKDVSASHPEEFARLSKLARGLHESARFMMYDNVVGK